MGLRRGQLEPVGQCPPIRALLLHVEELAQFRLQEGIQWVEFCARFQNKHELCDTPRKVWCQTTFQKPRKSSVSNRCAERLIETERPIRSLPTGVSGWPTLDGHIEIGRYQHMALSHNTWLYRVTHGFIASKQGASRASTTHWVEQPTVFFFRTDVMFWADEICHSLALQYVTHLRRGSSKLVVTWVTIRSRKWRKITGMMQCPYPKEARPENSAKQLRTLSFVARSTGFSPSSAESGGVVLSSGSAPQASSRVAISQHPPAAARCRAVYPWYVAALILASHCMHSWRQSEMAVLNIVLAESLMARTCTCCNFTPANMTILERRRALTML